MIALNDMHHFFIVVLLLISILLMVIHFVYIKVKLRTNDAINNFLNAHLMLIIWGMLLLLKYIMPPTVNDEIIPYLMTTSITFVGHQILSFAYIYSFKRRIKDRHAVLMLMIPFCSFLIYNVGFFISKPMGDLLIAASIGALIVYIILGIAYFTYYTLKTEGLNRTKQCVYFSAAIGFNLYAHVIFCLDSLGADVIYLINFMPVYLLFLIGFTMKYQLYDKIPFVLETIFHNANFGIIVMNNSFKVVDFNRKFFKNYMDIDHIETTEDFILQLKAVSDNKLSVDNILYATQNVEKNHYSGDLKIHNGHKEVFLDYTVNSINDALNQRIATMITFWDISEMTSLQKGIRNKNNQLVRANNKLQEHMKNVQELTIEKEREALMTEINDTFGHSMTEIMALLEVSVLLLEQDENLEAIETAIEETTTRARAALSQMRESVSRYKKGVTIND